MITTVIFDLDDTLYDEIDYCRSGFAAVSELLASRPGTPAADTIFNRLWGQFTAGNRTKTFNSVLDQLGLPYDDDFISGLVQAYRSHVPKIKLPADTRDVLSQLSAKYELALLTDGFLPAQKLKVQALGIEKHFACIIYTEQLGRNCWKPSPAGFEKLMQTLKAKPKNTAYVGDNEMKDFIAPNKLGIVSIQMIRPARLHSETSGQADAAPKYVIHKITRLTGLIEKI